VPVKNFKGVAVRRRVGRARTGGDVGGIVARNIGNDQCEHGRLARRGEPAPLNRGKVLSHGVDV